MRTSTIILLVLCGAVLLGFIVWMNGKNAAAKKQANTAPPELDIQFHDYKGGSFLGEVDGLVTSGGIFKIIKAF